MSKDKPIPIMPIYELCAQSAHLQLGDGLQIMNEQAIPHGTVPDAIALHLRNSTRDFHVLTLSDSPNLNGPLPTQHQGMLTIGPITNDSKHPLKIMVPASINVLAIGSMYGSKSNDGAVELYIDTNSQNKVDLILYGIPDNRESSTLQPNDYSAFTELHDPAGRCKVTAKPYHGETIVAHYKYNEEPMDLNVTGEVNLSQHFGHAFDFLD